MLVMARRVILPMRRSLFVAVATLVVATVAVAILQDGLGVPNPSAVYLVAVVATALVSGPVGAIAVSVASFLLYNWFFVEPRYTFTVAQPAEVLAILLLLFVGVVVGQLTALQRARTELARTREREARALFRLSRALATRETTAAALAEIATIIRDQAGMRRVWVSLGADEATERVATDTNAGEARPQPGTIATLRRMPGEAPAEWVRIHRPGVRPPSRARRSATTNRAAVSATYRVRIEASGASLGSIWALRDRNAPDPDRTETRLLAAAADQVGQALGHDRLVAERQAAEIARQSDAVKSALLQSVSHDLRTPLATIRAAAGSLRPGSGLSSDEQRESAEAIDREVEYLNRLVTNLLDLSRIDAGALIAERDVFELDDLVSRTMQRLRPRLADRPVEVAVTDRAVIVDPILLDQALTNIVENALKYAPAPAPLRIATTDLDGRIRLTVEDGGKGVPAESLGRLFEKFYRVPEKRPQSRAGTGIGLAVVRGLMEAMDGTATARQSELGGLAIDLELPATEVPAEIQSPSAGATRPTA
jgi:two-component system sensor histidine kinase KdpD